MKKICICILGTAMLFSSCTDNTGNGTYVGAQFGTILGSAIGGVLGGPRGSDVGTIIGMAGGAAVGAAVGAAADQREQTAIERRSQRYQQTYDDASYDYDGSDQSGYNPNNDGNDIIDFNGAGPSGATSAPRGEVRQQGGARPQGSFQRHDGIRLDQLKAASVLQIRKVRVAYARHDQQVHAGDQCSIQFEIMNTGNQPLYDVQPIVMEVSGNKQIHISPNLRVERIDPRNGVRYTATILAGKRLKDGVANIRIGAIVGNDQAHAQMQEITIATSRK